MPKSPLAPELDPNDEIQLVEHHRVGLQAGDYLLEMSQDVEVTTEGKGSPSAPFTRSQYFSVRGERFALDPQTVHAQFPPPGSRGDFWHVFPHVILNRSTLPWERSARTGDPDTDPPWLALLLFHDSDPPPKIAKKKDGSALTLADIKKASTASPYFPGFDLEHAQHPGDPVSVIDVEVGLLKQLLPTDFRYLNHARRRLAFLGTAKFTNEPGDDALLAELEKLIAGKQPALPETAHLEVALKDTKWRLRDRAHRQEYEIWLKSSQDHSYVFYRVAHETAVVLGSRLPQPGARNVVHLVSLEDRYKEDARTFNDQGAKAGDLIQLVSLMHWEFFCVEASKTFKWILESLNSRLVQASGGVLQGEGFSEPSVPRDASLSVVPGAGEKLEIQKNGGELVGKVVSGTGWDKAKKIDYDHRSKQWSVKDKGGALVEELQGTLLDLADHTPATFRLPVPDSAAGTEAERFLRAGYVPLPQFFRQGDRSISWYHGPLVPVLPREAAPDGKVDVNAASAEELREVDGIGPIRARYLIEQRPFRNAGELARVAGLPPSAVGKLYCGQWAQRLPASTADALVQFDKEWGLFDVSYAAAWELGRLLTLENRQVALALYEWKRRHASSLHAARNLLDYGYELPIHGPEGATADTRSTAAVDAWFEELALVRHVPFNYLVPDERLLPPESLRFFSIDPRWLDALRDGAFAVGRVLAGDGGRDAGLIQPSAVQIGTVKKADSNTVTLAETASGDYTGWSIHVFEGKGNYQHRTIVRYDDRTKVATIDKRWNVVPGTTSRYRLSERPFPPRPVSGLLLRSEAVAGWPGLRIDGYAKAVPKGGTIRDDSGIEAQGYPKLNILRMERLSKNVLLCLFDGEVQMADLHLRPETLHFGFDVSDRIGHSGNTGDLIKKLRDKDGNEMSDEIDGIVWSDEEKRIVDMVKLADTIQNGLNDVPDTDKPTNETAPEDGVAGSHGDALNPAIFALEMIAGTELVRFIRPSPKT